VTLVPLPNQTAPATIKREQHGWPVYGLQSGLKAVGHNLVVDGDFGPATEKATKVFQGKAKLTVDGLAGPATQKALVLAVLAAMDLSMLPKGLPRSLLEGEGGYNFGAVNWSVPGGVDCGLMQHRVPVPYSLHALEDAFYAPVAIIDACNDLRDRAYGNRQRDISGFIFSPYVLTLPVAQRKEMALRIALMAHNWPEAGGASFIAVHGKCSNPDAPCTWLPRDKNGNLVVRFPDGKLVQTRWEWCQFYAFGGPHGEARMTKYVEGWPT
jgi:hypothetical protein